MNEVVYYIVMLGISLLWISGIILFIKFLIRNILMIYHSNWNTLIDNFEYSTKEFYERLRKELESHGITKIDIREKYLSIGGALSQKRIYLRVTWKEYQYDICGAKFGHGFFISWWLLYKDSLGKIIISKIPVVGDWIAQKLYPVTYYRVDTASMFMSYAQSSVLKVIDDITKDKGTRALTESERKPILNDVFKR